MLTEMPVSESVDRVLPGEHGPEERTVVFGDGLEALVAFAVDEAATNSFVPQPFGEDLIARFDIALLAGPRRARGATRARKRACNDAGAAA